MNRQEYFRRRAELLAKQVELELKCISYHDCNNKELLPNFNPNAVCKGCPLYPPYREIGIKLTELTKQYRKANGIKPVTQEELDWIAMQWEKYKTTAMKYGVTKKVFRARMKIGWTAKKAATTRVKKKNRKK